MSIKSNWAFQNGKRIMKEAIEYNQSDCKAGWVERNGAFLYQEINNNTKKLSVKTYANKKQCLAKIEKIKAGGVDCCMSLRYPFTIIRG